MLRIINGGVEECVDVGARAERVAERRDAAARRSATRTRRAGGGTLRGTPLRSAYETFLLERVGLRVQPRTLEFYELTLGKHFLGWLEAEHPDITAIEDVDVQVMRTSASSVGTVREHTGGEPPGSSKMVLTASWRAALTRRSTRSW